MLCTRARHNGGLGLRIGGVCFFWAPVFGRSPSAAAAAAVVARDTRVVNNINKYVARSGTKYKDKHVHVCI